ncbi:MAG TPA: RNA methyltransferase [Jiangellales bacterium]|nr:RNA methyltransferase [Jiangellales bacterium]
MTPDRLAPAGVLGPRSARVRRARRLTGRPAREESGLFLVEGPQGLREAVRRPDLLEEVYVTPGAAGRYAGLVAEAAAGGADVVAVDDDALVSLAETVTPQGVVAVCRTVTVPLAVAVAGAPRLVALLVEVQDPGNAGTVVRCADASGADAVILTAGSVDPHNGKAVRASAGSLFHLPVVTGPGLQDAVLACRSAGLTVLAADGRADLDLDDAERARLLDAPTVWLFGNEAHGLAPAATALADHAVRVPVYGAAESLNLATAAAVCLYASARCQRRDPAVSS